jgi:hypothetical protein
VRVPVGEQLLRVVDRRFELAARAAGQPDVN